MTNTNIRNSLKSKYSTVGVFLMSHNWKTWEHFSHLNFEEEQKRVCVKDYFLNQNQNQNQNTKSKSFHRETKTGVMICHMT